MAPATLVLTTPLTNTSTFRNTWLAFRCIERLWWSCVNYRKNGEQKIQRSNEVLEREAFLFLLIILPAYDWRKEKGCSMVWIIRPSSMKAWIFSYELAHQLMWYPFTTFHYPVVPEVGWGKIRGARLTIIKRTIQWRVPRRFFMFWPLQRLTKSCLGKCVGL